MNYLMIRIRITQNYNNFQINMQVINTPRAGKGQAAGGRNSK